jgi:hypothetical protein
VYNGVAVRKHRLLDHPRHDEQADYERALIDGIRSVTENGDGVCVVGGGLGVSTVVAARQVGDAGSVTTFEAARQGVERVTRTVELNQVAERVRVRHSVVSDDISVWGSVGDATRLSPDQLPVSDVLVLDCEGAEDDILEGIAFTPRAVIVETHGCFGVPKEDVVSTLRANRYTIRSVNPEVPERNIYVIVAEM